MHGPGVTVQDALSPRDGLEPPTADLAGTARRDGVVGHTQTAATARRRGKPIILRRDFNGVEQGQPLVHFVALARTIDDFEATRRAMNGAQAMAAGPAVGRRSTTASTSGSPCTIARTSSSRRAPPARSPAFPARRRPHERPIGGGARSPGDGRRRAGRHARSRARRVPACGRTDGPYGVVVRAQPTTRSAGTAVDVTAYVVGQRLGEPDLGAKLTLRLSGPDGTRVLHPVLVGDGYEAIVPVRSADAWRHWSVDATVVGDEGTARVHGDPLDDAATIPGWAPPAGGALLAGALLVGVVVWRRRGGAPAAEEDAVDDWGPRPRPHGPRRLIRRGRASVLRDRRDHGCSGRGDEIGRREAEVEATPAAAHVHGVEQLGGLVEHGRGGACAARPARSRRRRSPSCAARRPDRPSPLACRRRPTPALRDRACRSPARSRRWSCPSTSASSVLNTCSGSSPSACAASAPKFRLRGSCS